MKKFFPKVPAFTLVELIVVITIVGILSTIGFVSYSGYLGSARDGNRISSITKLSDSLQTYATSKFLPLPDDAITIEASGAIIGYQGYVGENVLETINYTNGGKDPKDESYYTYYLTKDRKKLQLLTFLENQTAFQNTELHTNTSYAADYSKRFPKTYGQKLGILVSVETITLNTPAQEIDINKTAGKLDVVTTSSNYTAMIDETESITGTGIALQASIPNGSCKRIKETGGSKGSGFYTLNFGGDIREMYCYMEGGEAIEDMLEGEGDFMGGEGISTEYGSNATNTIEKLQNPISSGYVVHQTGSPTSEYEIHFKDMSKCKSGDTIYMTLWVGNRSIDDNIFQSRVSYSDSAISTSKSNIELLEEKNINGIAWRKVGVLMNINSSKIPSDFSWFIGWNNSAQSPYNNGYLDDFYFTGVRLSCHP